MASAYCVKVSAKNDPRAIHADNVTESAADKVSELLNLNHEKFHIYYDDHGFHNHILHELLALYPLGATPEELQMAFDHNAVYQKLIGPPSMEVVTELQHPAQFQKYLAQPKHYKDFLKFFKDEVETKGVEETLRKYVFKDDIENDERANDMFTRMFGGFLHPLLHLGYGLEFHQPLIVAEALAQAAIHLNEVGQFCYPPEKSAQSRAERPNVTLISLADRLRADPHIASSIHWGESSNMLNDSVVPHIGDRVAAVASEFTVQPHELAQKTAEVIHATIYITAASQQPGKIEMFDFFLMHCANLSYFYPIFINQSWIPDTCKCRLLEWLAWTLLTGYAACCTPELYPDRISSYQPKRPGDWRSIFTRANSYRDDGHSAKLIRALKRAEQTLSPNPGGLGFHLPIDSFVTIAHMVMDSVERQNEPDYHVPAMDWFYSDIAEDALRLADRFVRWCGFKESWAQVPDKVQSNGTNIK